MSQDHATVHHSRGESGSKLLTGHLLACFDVSLQYCVSLRRPTSPGVVNVGHSVCGLDGSEVGLQGEQLAGQVWHTARRN